MRTYGASATVQWLAPAPAASGTGPAGGRGSPEVGGISVRDREREWMARCCGSPSDAVAQGRAWASGQTVMHAARAMCTLREALQGVTAGRGVRSGVSMDERILYEAAGTSETCMDEEFADKRASENSVRPQTRPCWTETLQPIVKRRQHTGTTRVSDSHGRGRGTLVVIHDRTTRPKAR
ncbi:hypothetical protein BD414DRAFT_38248 [Trametes punicea]|nr:hypothetical protein BD414DRAFT_38248 [Trametes punicea]